jgi:hypothetical protein
MPEDKQSINLKIETKIGSIFVEDIVEYCAGKLYFYIYEKNHTVKTIKRDVILEVFRYNGNHIWEVSLKTFKERQPNDPYKR